MTESPILRHQKLTILQQIDELKNWHRQQQAKLNSSCSSQENGDLTNENEDKLSLVGNNKKSSPRSETINNNRNSKPSWSSFDDTPIKTSLHNYDDTPVKGLQHNLNASAENIIPSTGNHHHEINHNNEKPKFRFLKKGEGIARFRMGPVKVKRSKSNKKLNLQPTSTKITKELLDESGGKKSSKAPGEIVHESERLEKVPILQPPDLKLDFRNWKAILSSGNAIELIENAIDNNQLEVFQPNMSIDSSTASIMERLLVLGRKHLKDKEEMRVFETIEQHVLDSSFCSTSSYVNKLMENAVMSTPEKKSNNENEISNYVQSEQFCPSVSNENHITNIHQKEVEGSSDLGTAPLWTEPFKNEHLGNKLVSDSNHSDLEQSLHVRFNEEVDYKSFVEFSRSLSDQLITNDQFQDNDEWKDNSSETSSVCCSHCSSGTTSDVRPDGTVGCDEDRATIDCPIKKMDVKDLATDNNEVADDEGPSFEEINAFSPILNAKLKELEHEIEAFRTENSKLKSMREKLIKDRKQFELEKKKFLNEIEQEIQKNATYIEGEKQKLAKEKFIFEKYSKNLNKKPMKEERKEMQALRDQINEMKEELNKKESRWGAAQARVRNQVKLLEEDNKKLKEEIEVLRRQSKSLQILTQKKNKTSVNNTKLIHAINEHISGIGAISDDLNLKDSTYFSNGTIKTVSVEDVDPKSIKTLKVIKENEQQKLPSNLKEPLNKSLQPQDSLGGNATKTNHDLSPNRSSDIGKVSDETLEIPSKSNVEDNSISSIREIINEDGHVEKIYPDGRKEVRFKNGNIKKIDPVSGCVKTIYFNGDVRELTSNGTVKYYFSEGRIWHTTYPDGLEVLDFPNGQVEKRHTNGVVEIIYPSDCKKITYPDGLEEIFYPDGTNIKIEGKNKKTLSLPNGQKEIHTEESIRREYPDGTVKIVYPDGTTETVYSNGRVRLKDKHGNLVMDSGSTAPIKL